MCLHSAPAYTLQTGNHRPCPHSPHRVFLMLSGEAARAPCEPFRVYPHPKGKTLKNLRFINQIGGLENLHASYLFHVSTRHICFMFSRLIFVFTACAGLPRPRVGPRGEFHTPRNCSTQHPLWASKCRLFVLDSGASGSQQRGYNLQFF